MTSQQLERAVAEITAEADPTTKHLRLASLCAAVFQEHGIRLVVVGGSAIEFYTEGAYVSGDLDLCVEFAPAGLTPHLRQEIMNRLGAVGGPRSWQVGGAFVDVLAGFENLALTPIRSLQGPYGEVRISPVEELIVERVLIGHYTARYPPALACAKKLIAAALQGEVETDWSEVRRLAQSPACRNWDHVQTLIHEQAQALQVRSPGDSDE
jgi:hypothetical protein